MRYIFKFPDIGEGLEEGTIIEWYVAKGQKIKSGDALVKMETDKVVTDIPSPKAGTVVNVYGKAGETLHVGSPLVELEIEGSAEENRIKEEENASHQEAIEEGSVGVVGTLEVAGGNAYLPASEEGAEQKTAEQNSSRKVLSTPVARALAKDLNINITLVKGTGPAGRVTKSDIYKYAESSAAPQLQVVTDTEAVTYEPLTQIRKAIARNMTLSHQNTVPMTVHEETEVSELVRIREKFKNQYAEKNIKLTYLAFIVKATVLALKSHKVLNAQLDMENNRIIYKNYVNIGIAVDTPEGLVVPVIRNADKLSLGEIALKIQELGEKAKERKLSLEDMKDGTFTITNYGAIGGIFGNAVINYPQSGILGIGRMMKKPIVKNDQIVVGNILPLSLTVDHRIVDGGETTRFIKQIMAYLEEPASMIFDNI